MVGVMLVGGGVFPFLFLDPLTKNENMQIKIIYFSKVTKIALLYLLKKQKISHNEKKILYKITAFRIFSQEKCGAVA